ncbi:nuclear transport factor 2 family protein [Mesorhizobium sp. M0088]|uniref:nuclear transport factor 2 family protein n=1 Tax=Mesorhizobium sp. M0088 TaxID=2956873 RepID=UPI003334E42E
MKDAYAAVDRFSAVWAKPDLEGIRSLMHEDTRNPIPPMTEPAGREGVVAHFAEVLARLPDLTVSVIRWAPTGDSVLVEWRANATVAGQPVSWTGVDRFGVRGERMYEARVYWDTRQVAEMIASIMREATARAAQGGTTQ